MAGIVHISGLLRKRVPYGVSVIRVRLGKGHVASDRRRILYEEFVQTRSVLAVLHRIQSRKIHRRTGIPISGCYDGARDVVRITIENERPAAAVGRHVAIGRKRGVSSGSVRIDGVVSRGARSIDLFFLDTAALRYAGVRIESEIGRARHVRSRFRSAGRNRAVGTGERLRIRLGSARYRRRRSSNKRSAVIESRERIRAGVYRLGRSSAIGSCRTVRGTRCGRSAVLTGARP